LFLVVKKIFNFVFVCKESTVELAFFFVFLHLLYPKAIKGNPVGKSFFEKFSAMKTTRLVLAFLLLFSCTYGVFAQQIPKDLDDQISYYQEKGDNAFDEGNYTDAITYYEKLLVLVEGKHGKDHP
jgi:hypothetical protein